MLKSSILHFASLLVCLPSCINDETNEEFSFYLDEPCMIVNQEQDNSSEGTYLMVQSVSIANQTIVVSLPGDLYVTRVRHENWVVGWGTGLAYHDAGVENIRGINNINNNTGEIALGMLSRGKGMPEIGQNIVLWNTKPSGYESVAGEPVIDPKRWDGFSGMSIAMSFVEYDSSLAKWVMVFNECDTSDIQIYAAISSDLIHWDPFNDGRAILGTADFKNCSWAGRDKTGRRQQTPVACDITRKDQTWCMLLNGYDENGKKNVGFAFSSTSLTGPYLVSPSPAVRPGPVGSWCDAAISYSKIVRGNGGYILFFDGYNRAGEENIGRAFSEDMINWEVHTKNPVIENHRGWRSSMLCSEPCMAEARGDSTFLVVAGMKSFETGLWSRLRQAVFRGKPGNVDDTQLGVFLSTDGGRSFAPHKNNPVFVNNYTDKYENEHLGFGFELIDTDTAQFLFYQAKSSHESDRYNVRVRVKRK